jgi:CMP-N-acetylneuraminic acid synthetase
MVNILGIVPARSGSKGIPAKNIKDLNRKPLLAYTAEAAKASGIIDRLILTTNSKEIADLGLRFGLEVPFMRPNHLAADDSPMLDVLKHAVDEMDKLGWKTDIVVLLQPTSPLRKPKHIIEAIGLLQQKECDSVVSVVEIPDTFAPQKALHIENGFLRFLTPAGKKITRRQQLTKTFAREGTIYVCWRDVLMGKGSLYGDKCLPLILSREESLNLDTLEDWAIAEQILSTSGPNPVGVKINRMVQK